MRPLPEQTPADAETGRIPAVSLIVEGSLFALGAIVVLRAFSRPRPRFEHRLAGLATTP
jgi:hypothetical protein